MIKTIIFDNNGVLTTCDDNKTIPEFAKYFDVDEVCLREMFHRVVVPADLGQITTDEFFRRLAKELGKTYSPDTLWPIFLSCYVPIPEMRDLLLTLRKSFQIAILTNFVDAFDRLNKEVWHYEDIFDYKNVFVSSRLHLAKPDKVFYKYALDKLDCFPGEVIFVDDREANLVSARSLGIKTIHFTTPEQCKNELQLLIGEQDGKK